MPNERKLQNVPLRRRHWRSSLVDAGATEVGSFDERLSRAIWIANRQIGIEPDFDRALPLEPGKTRRRPTHPFDELVERVAARLRFGPRGSEAELERRDMRMI